ncbi:Na(+)/H(+) exchange regulatory cofactor NHE-RF4 isoform X6 [Alexandromys fortis]|uniref:Na(+)/H(+) exchange regulatory cofactor NHE-RF4 isoform X6 n=1 Tax=Alexandromys fortis TaxID=100897 RepID=UPI002152A705|nr:Na(+)/H(+) exchange regulatory cofactor NHE-RF4 isoform X6 [Microtus fortis]
MNLVPTLKSWVTDPTMEATAADLGDTAMLTLKFKFNPRLGIDNPVLSLAEDQAQSGNLLTPGNDYLSLETLQCHTASCLLDPWNLQRPRFCLLSREEQKNFGFHLLYQLGKADHVVYRVDPGSSAQRHGLREGDRILAVNNNIVDHEDYAMLWQSGYQVTLLVAAPEVEERCRQLGMPLAAPLAEGWALPSKPRCLNIEKGPQGFGFLLREEKGLDGCLGQFLWEVDPGLPADKAGMKAGDRLVAVAGESVDGLCHEETVSRIRAQGSRVSLIVVDPEADRFFNMVRLSPLLFLENTENAASPLAETKDFAAEDTVEPSSPVGSRQCFLYPGPGGGYGFKLCCVASRPCLFVSQVTPGGSAARAGLQMGDAVLEVNGYPVGADNDLNRLQQLTEAEPPLCLKLAARDPQDLEAWISSESGKDWTLPSELL